RFQLIEPFLKARRTQPLHDSRHETVDLAVQGQEFTFKSGPCRLGFVTLAINLFMKAADELFYEVWGHQPVLQLVKDDLLKLAPPDAAAVRTGAPAASRGAYEVILTGCRVRSVTAAAMDQSGEEMPRATLLPELFGARLGDGVAGADPLLNGFDGLPEIVFDNSQVWHLLDDPLIRRIHSRSPATGLGVFQ